MSVQLFVEKLNGDKTMGITSNTAMMLENANRIRIKNVKHTDDMVGLIFQAGRYVAGTMMDAEKQLGMFFIDCKKDRRIALAYASNLTGEAKDLFMKNFDEVTRNYEQNYNLIELVVSNNFPSDLSAN